MATTICVGFGRTWKTNTINQSRLKFDKRKWTDIKTLVDQVWATKMTVQNEALTTLRTGIPSASTIINKSYQPSHPSQQERERHRSQLNDMNSSAQQPQFQTQRSQRHESDLESNSKRTLHMIGYKKLSGLALDDEEKKTLAKINTGFTMKDALYSLAATTLIKDNLSLLDKCIAKLSLSSIVNLMNPVVRKTTMEHLDEQRQLELENETSDQKCGVTGLECESSDMFDTIIGLNEDVDGILAFIQTTKGTLSGTKRKNSQVYAMLCVMEQTIENFSLWYKDGHESEMTFYRRFAGLLDIIFKRTPIELADCVFETSDASSSTYARKIDLLAKFDDHQSVELSSNEWKKYDVSGDIVMKQQCKNLRINASVMSALMAEYGKQFNKMMAMDWIGNIGYMYSLEKKEDVFVSRLHDKLMIPKDLLHLAQVKSTLDNLFMFRNFMVNTCQELQKRSLELNMNKRLWNIAGHQPVPSSSLASPSSPTSPYIYFTPRTQRIRKRKLIDLDD